MSNGDSTKKFALWPLFGDQDSPPPTTQVDVEISAQSRRGRLHSVNDDHFVVARLGRSQETLLTSLPQGELPRRFDESGYAMVVADGGGKAGEVASRLAVSTLVHLAVAFGRWNVRVNEPIADEMIDRADRYFRSIDAALVQASHTVPGGLQSALTAVYSAGDELFFMHVGRSRVYLFRDDVLMQLTRDQIRAGGEPGEGVVVDIATREQAPRQLRTETLGRSGPGSARIDIERCGLVDGDVVLLCTNGLTDLVDDKRIAEALRQQNTLDELCTALVNLAADSGGTDDVTVVVAHYHITE